MKILNSPKRTSPTKNSKENDSPISSQPNRIMKKLYAHLVLHEQAQIDSLQRGIYNMYKNYLENAYKADYCRKREILHRSQLEECIPNSTEKGQSHDNSILYKDCSVKIIRTATGKHMGPGYYEVDLGNMGKSKKTHNMMAVKEFQGFLKIGKRARSPIPHNCNEGEKLVQKFYNNPERNAILKWNASPRRSLFQIKSSIKSPQWEMGMGIVNVSPREGKFQRRLFKENYEEDKGDTCETDKEETKKKYIQLKEKENAKNELAFSKDVSDEETEIDQIEDSPVKINNVR